MISFLKNASDNSFRVRLMTHIREDKYVPAVMVCETHYIKKYPLWNVE